MEQTTESYTNNFVKMNFTRDMDANMYVHVQDPAIISPLERSRQILAGLNSYQNLSKPDVNCCNEPIELNSCKFCQRIVSAKSDNTCKLCNEFYCLKHKSEINHKCENFLPSRKGIYWPKISLKQD